MKHYLIVGQGLAGILIANQLKEHNKSFLAIADKKLISATSVAAGMYNPLVFRRITKSWMVDDLLPEMYATYTSLENKLNRKLIYPKPIIKLLAEDEYQRWILKQENPQIAKYIEKLESKAPINGIYNYYGFAKISNSGYVDLNALTEGFHQTLIENNSIVYDHFNYNDLNINDNHITWKGGHFKNIIFCEGAFAVNNPLFNQVGYKLTKGDVLTLAVDKIQLDYIVNKQIFLMEKTQGKFLCGSTYNWEELDYQTRTKDAEYLSQKLATILNKPFEIKKHETAIRPTVIDRRPVLGTHPTFKNIHYFNGLGTKGVMLAPYFSKQMVNYLENDEALHSEVNIKRFYK